MPKGQVRETEHAVFTDHSIPRSRSLSSIATGSELSLAVFWNTPQDDRDLGLAYAMLDSEKPDFGRRAVPLLEKAQARNPDDVPVLIQLAQIHDEAGHEDRAAALNERIIRLDPSQTAVAVNLGTDYMNHGRAHEAMRLWKDALARNPGLTAARLNLAIAQQQAGDPSSAEATLRTALEFDPDHETARKLLAEIQAARR